MTDLAFDRLQLKHESIEDALWSMPDMIGSSNWSRIQKRERELRYERIQRCLDR